MATTFFLRCKLLCLPLQYVGNLSDIIIFEHWHRNKKPLEKMSKFEEQIIAEDMENEQLRILKQNYGTCNEKRERHEKLEGGQSQRMMVIMDKRMKGCSSWAYYLTVLLLTAFVATVFWMQVETNYHHTQKFAINLAQLRHSASPKPHQNPQHNSGHHVSSTYSTQNNPGVLYSGNVLTKINFKSFQEKKEIASQSKRNPQYLSNSASINSKQPTKHEQLKPKIQQPSTSINYVTPQNPFMPYAPSIDQLKKKHEPSPPVLRDLADFQPQFNGETNIPASPQSISSLSISNVDYLVPSSSTNQFIKVQNTLSPFEISDSSSTLVVPSPNFTGFSVSQQFESSGSDQKSKESSVNPIIYPFNNPQEKFTKDNDYDFDGSFASISIMQISNARRFKTLVDKDRFIMDKLAQQEKNYYEQRYNISNYEQLPFCIVVPTYNNVNKDRYLKNIKSIVMQDYKNFHIVVIDDASTDNTGTLIKRYLKNQKYVSADRYQVLINPFQLKAMPNLRNAALNHCKPEEIFLIVDGDDQLIGRQVLKLYNSVFQEKKLWFVYSNFLTTSGGVGFSRPFPEKTIINNSYRTYSFVTSHLRAFYTQLFRNIKEEDLKDPDGEYLRAANDVAICIPILQQAHERVGYLPELTYYYNSNTGLNNHQVRLSEQRINDHMVRKYPNYKRLDQLLG